MPYGLANAPAVFQSFINEIFKELLNKYVVAYIDDILIYSKTHVKTVQSRLLENQLYVKAEKCECHVKQTSFLGYNFSLQGVEMDSSKISAAIEWPQPSPKHTISHTIHSGGHQWLRMWLTMSSPAQSVPSPKHPKNYPLVCYNLWPFPNPWSHLSIDFITDLPPSN